MTSAASLTFVVCGAPLAYRAADVAAALVEDGWNVTVVATPAARDWLDAEQVEAAIGTPPASNYRQPHEPKRGKPPEQVVICPLTLNTGSKLAAGIMDNYAVGVLCEALAVGTPIVAVTMVNERLWQHPSWSRNLDTIRAGRVSFLDPRSGRLGEPKPVLSGTGSEIVERFDPAWVVGAVSKRSTQLS
jgi:phosphopantothenoylcysteine synthetase/decarboxylase